ncbi:MAG TPA: glycosyltransferase, partial [Ktedonobacterales bacterium]|nr:glycosyltransferase [Ktedonobacterales bacterium]
MSRNWVEPTTFSALLVAPSHEQGDSVPRLLALATGLRARGHRVQIVATDAATSEAFRARDIPCWLMRHAAEQQSSPGELATFARAIFHALSAEPTHIIHTTSLRATYAAALASFAFTLRHPCAPE